jgi:hypothetical protein
VRALFRASWLKRSGLRPPDIALEIIFEPKIFMGSNDRRQGMQLMLGQLQVR